MCHVCVKYFLFLENVSWIEEKHALQVKVISKDPKYLKNDLRCINLFIYILHACEESYVCKKARTWLMHNSIKNYIN